MTEPILSTGNICEPYECMDVIFSFTSTEGGFDYAGASRLLANVAKENEADGVIYISFSERTASGTKQACFQTQAITLFEVYARGTMIKLKK